MGPHLQITETDMDPHHYIISCQASQLHVETLFGLVWVLNKKGHTISGIIEQYHVFDMPAARTLCKQRGFEMRRSADENEPLSAPSPGCRLAKG
jgi:hypothetical protein